MKRILLIAVIAVIGSALFEAAAQKTKVDKEQQKRERAIADSIDHVIALRSLKDSTFVLKVNRATFKRGRSTMVSETTNFISLKKKRAVIQLAFDIPVWGPNGLGGITVEGTISNVSIRTDKKGNTYYRFNVSGIAVSAMVDITLYNGGNSANAVVSPNFNSNRIMLDGNIVPFSGANIFKGNSL